jgi:hypothetical protein
MFPHELRQFASTLVTRQLRKRIRFLCLVACVIAFSNADQAQEYQEKAFPNDHPVNVTELDCYMRYFALQYARYIQPWRIYDDSVFRQVEEALQIGLLCPQRRYQIDFEFSRPLQNQRQEATSKENFSSVCKTSNCIYIDKKSLENNEVISDSRKMVVVSNIANALKISREQWKDPYQTTLIFRAGIHYIGSGLDQKHQALELSLDDSGLTLTGEPDAWLSGAVELPNDDTFWNSTVEYPPNKAVRVANLSEFFEFHDITALPKIISVFGPELRYVRARYPNSNPEVDQWGYNSPQRLLFSLAADHVLEWHKPQANGPIPRFSYTDLRFNADDHTRPIKNDSTMEMYNAYGAGLGGVCNTLWGNESSYWCSNISAGGWAEVDRESALLGQLQIPVGMTYNLTNRIGQRMGQWHQSAIGGIIHSWHSQSWAMHMFEIQSSKAGTFTFSKGGGKQGGRNWCRCDQCSYAAPWCGQRQSPPNHSDTRLISGTWYIENVLPELDVPGEFFFDRKSNVLYIFPNHTDVENSASSQYAGVSGLRFSILEQLIRLSNGVTNISISNLGFRDTASTYMSNWSVPSGGDWSIHRGGAIFMEDVNNIRIQNCKFSRLDGNAIFLSRRTRNVTISRNLFQWIGESAIALWGDTDGYNATARKFPLNTRIEGNVMSELGIYQKQSSSVFISKAALTTIRNNIMFNIARAAINFNDMVGGGDIVDRNVIFNTCRESGDHGPINSWDRQPFLTEMRDGFTPSFVPIRRIISYNLIFANYGANQGIDNDDGSSWYHVHHNVMYWSNGFKMDYGGHDSIFEDNLVIGYPHKRVCVGFGSFFEDHGHIVRRNTCLAGNGNEAMIQLETCKNNHAILHDNKYFSPNGRAFCQCGYNDPVIPLDDLQSTFGIEKGSTVDLLPGDPEVVMRWAIDVFFSQELPFQIC